MGDMIEIGQRFGRLTVSGPDFVAKRKDGRKNNRYCPCVCDCGSETSVVIHRLKSGHTKSCGCLITEMRAERNRKAQESASFTQVSIGDRFGILTVKSVLNKTDASGRTRHLFSCVCDCGSMKDIDAYNLMKGATKSCGCILCEITRKRSTTHGDAPRKNRSRLYCIWNKMRERCRQPNNNRYSVYGAKGIFVCEEWQTFEAFRDWALSHGYADNLSIDRIDNDLPYHPDNCRWATMQEQMVNKTTNVFIEAFGEEKCISEWARDPRCKVKYETLRSRLQVSFWEPEHAITAPLTTPRHSKPPQETPAGGLMRWRISVL